MALGVPILKHFRVMWYMKFKEELNCTYTGIFKILVKFLCDGQGTVR